MIKKTTIWIGVFGLAASAAMAAPLERNHLAANAIWVAHVDVDKFKQTEMGQFLLAEMEKPQAQNKLAAFQAVFNFDPRKNVRSVTLYGTGTKPDEGTLLVEGDFDTTRLVTLAMAAKNYQSAQHRQHLIHQWTDEAKTKRTGKEVRTAAALSPGGGVLFGQTFEAVAAALDVMDGMKPNLSSTAWFNDLSTQGAFFLQAATRKVEVPDHQAHSAMLRQMQYLSLTAAESGGTMQMQVFAQANSEEIARNILQIGQGLIALMSLQTNKPEAAQFAQALSLQQSGAQITATLTMPSAKVIEGMKQKAARKAAAQKQD